MKFCLKCGKEIHDEAVICVHCGCSTGSTALIDAKSSNGHPIIKQSLGLIFGICLLGGLLFGLLFGLFFGAVIAEEGDFVPAFMTTFILSGALFAGAFFLATALILNYLQNSVFANIRAKVKSQGKIYFEGAANYKGNGGCLFVTEKGFEHYPHKVNFNTSPILISHSDVVAVRVSGRKLVVRTNQATYEFVIANGKTWYSLLGQYEATRTKLISNY